MPWRKGQEGTATKVCVYTRKGLNSSGVSSGNSLAILRVYYEYIYIYIYLCVYNEISTILIVADRERGRGG